MTFNGNALLTRFSQKFGMTDTASKARVLEWINEIQEDICSFNFPFLKVKLKKTIPIGTKEIDLSPDVPGAATAAIAAGGNLEENSIYSFKVTFLIFDESGKEINTIESEPGNVSGSVTATAANKKANLTNIPVYQTSGVTVHRRIYMKKGSNPFYLVSTIQNNADTTVSISDEASGTIQPPEGSMVNELSGEDPTIDSLNTEIHSVTIAKINSFDPNGTATGTPYYYSRIDERRIRIYPAPSTEVVISFYVYRIPSCIFDDPDRVIQLNRKIKKVLDAGVLWKGLEYKDNESQEVKLRNYEAMKKDLIQSITPSKGRPATVRDVDGDWQGYEV